MTKQLRKNDTLLCDTASVSGKVLSVYIFYCHNNFFDIGIIFLIIINEEIKVSLLML